eukprot:jgi/Mesvir1/10023/Mv26161-RA.1
MIRKPGGFESAVVPAASRLEARQSFIPYAFHFHPTKDAVCAHETKSTCK